VLIKWGIDLWEDDNYSHGMLIPFISLYFIRERMGRISAAVPQSCWLGLPVIIAGLGLFLLGFVGAELFSKRISLLVVLYGLVLFLEGGKRAGLLLFPIGILFFAVPLPYVLYNAIAFPMKLVATKIAVWLLDLYGMPVFREGNIVHLPHTTLEVVDACSGIRSLMTLITLAFFLAYLRHNRFWQHGVLMLLALPVAVAANAARVALNGVMSRFYPGFVDSFWHEFSGWLLFVFCFVFLWGISALLGKKETDKATRLT
ncbi:MAG: exosortase/archaeosortase family protein, partial [Thermodesulfobacteriota bacterium]